MDSSDGIKDELEGSVAIMYRFEALRDLREDSDFVDLVNVGDNICVGVFVFEEEGTDICRSASEHFVNRCYSCLILNKDRF